MIEFLVGHRLRRGWTPSTQQHVRERRRMEAKEHPRCVGTVLMQVNERKNEVTELNPYRRANGGSGEGQ